MKASPKPWTPRSTAELKRLMRCVNSVECVRCRYSTEGNPLHLPAGWILFDDGAIFCDDCQTEIATGVRRPVRPL